MDGHRPLSPEYDYFVKLVVVGDPGCGKSALIFRFAEGRFPTPREVEGPFGFKWRTLEADGRVIKLQIWDPLWTSMRCPTCATYRGSNAIVVLFDVMNSESFERVKLWLQDIDRYTPENVVRFLCASKIDLIAIGGLQPTLQMWSCLHRPILTLLGFRLISVANSTVYQASENACREGSGHGICRGRGSNIWSAARRNGDKRTMTCPSIAKAVIARRENTRQAPQPLRFAPKRDRACSLS